MLEYLFLSRTRSRLIELFFSDTDRDYWLREAARAVDMNINAVRREVLRLEEAGILTGMKRGNQRLFRADSTHPFFPDLCSMVEKERSCGRVRLPAKGCETGVVSRKHGTPAHDSASRPVSSGERTRRGVCYRVDEDR